MAPASGRRNRRQTSKIIAEQQVRCRVARNKLAVQTPFRYTKPMRTRLNSLLLLSLGLSRPWAPL